MLPLSLHYSPSLFPLCDSVIPHLIHIFTFISHSSSVERSWTLTCGAQTVEWWAVLSKDQQFVSWYQCVWWLSFFPVHLSHIMMSYVNVFCSFVCNILFYLCIGSLPSSAPTWTPTPTRVVSSILFLIQQQTSPCAQLQQMRVRQSVDICYSN